MEIYKFFPFNYLDRKIKKYKKREIQTLFFSFSFLFSLSTHGCLLAFCSLGSLSFFAYSNASFFLSIFYQRSAFFPFSLCPLEGSFVKRINRSCFGSMRNRQSRPARAVASCVRTQNLILVMACTPWSSRVQAVNQDK